MVTAPRFSSPNQPDQERTTAYRDSSGPKLRSDAHIATIVGDWEKPYGESQFNALTWNGLFIAGIGWLLLIFSVRTRIGLFYRAWLSGNIGQRYRHRHFIWGMSDLIVPVWNFTDGRDGHLVDAVVRGEQNRTIDAVSCDSF